MFNGFIDTNSFGLGVGIALIVGPIAKNLLVMFFPATAKIFYLIDFSQQELMRVINSSNEMLNKNSDLKIFAKNNNLRIAEKLIKIN